MGGKIISSSFSVSQCLTGIRKSRFESNLKKLNCEVLFFKFYTSVERFLLKLTFEPHGFLQTTQAQFFL